MKHYNRGNLNAVGKKYLFSGHDSDGPFNSMHQQPDCCSPPLSLIEKAMASICLVTIDDGVWASGVVLNSQGLILTNAHLLEPWRFGKTVARGGRCGAEPEIPFIPSEESVYCRDEGTYSHQKSQDLLPKTLKIAGSSVMDGHGGYKSSSTYRGHRNIRIRLDHTDPRIWCDARVVYVSKGPLDIALLQLEFVPGQLCPIIMDFACPSAGSKAYVIGHGLFGPRCGKVLLTLFIYFGWVWKSQETTSITFWMSLVCQMHRICFQDFSTCTFSYDATELWRILLSNSMKDKLDKCCFHRIFKHALIFYRFCS